MADASRSPLAPFEALSFRNSLAAGAVLGLLVIGLAWGLGPMEVEHDAPHGPKDRISAAPIAAEGGATAAAADGGGGGGADANDDDGDGRGDGNGDDDEGIDEDGGDDDEGIEDDGDGDDDDEGGDDTPTEEPDGDDPNDEDDAAGMDTTAGDEMVLEDDEGDEGGEENEAGDDGDGDGGRKSNAGAGSTPTGKPDPTADMTPEELYDEAKKAFDEKRYRDAYRLATRSYYKKKSDKTLLLKGKAACGMKDEKAAKNAMKSFGLSDDRRKTIRNFCRDRGVRVGL